MNIDGKPYRTIWLEPDGATVAIIDQTKLPFALETVRSARCKTPPAPSPPCRCAARR